MNVAVILVGGTGARMGGNTPKQFLQINDKPIFIHTIECFLKVKNINRIVLVINKDFKNEYINFLNEFYSLKNIEICFGGKTRQESSFNALKYLKENNINDDDIILIHDGARANVSEEIIENNIKLCKENKKSVSTIINIVDTIIDKNYNTIDRSNLLAVQTPQTFIFKDIFNFHSLALEKNIYNASDDAQLAKILEQEVLFVNGSRDNIKITTPEDLLLFSYYLGK